MRHNLIRVSFALLLLTVFSQVYSADKIALVIGNNNYQLEPLETPVMDARAIAQKFNNMGFSVILGINTTETEMHQAFTQFSQEAKQAQIAVIYYAGYSIQVDSKNYLIPIDLNPVLEKDLSSLPTLEKIIKSASSVSQFAFLMIDASYKNPFAEKLYADIGRDAGGIGLAEVKNIPKNVILSYAAQADKYALDKQNNSNSFYTEALLKSLNSTDDLRLLLSTVRNKVENHTASQQTPVSFDALGDGTFCLSCIADVFAVNPPTLPDFSPNPHVVKDDPIEKMRNKLKAKDYQFDTPKELNIKQENQKPIRFSLNFSELKKEFHTIANTQGEKSLDKPITVIAKLTGQDFDISAIGAERREILEDMENEWQWSIRPKEAGSHSLYLSVSMISPLSGDPIALINPVERKILISETLPQKTMRFIDKNADLFIATISGISSIFVSIYLFIRRKRGRKLENGSPIDEN